MVKAYSGPQETLVISDPSLPEVGCDPATVERDFRPVLDRYLVRLDAPMDKSRGGIAVPDSSVPQSRTGVVVRAGPGMLSEDGKTLLPMHAREGQRILFEYAAGYAIPRVPDFTGPRGPGYKVIRDGSIVATIEGGPITPDEDPLPRMELVQDWLAIRFDRPQTTVRMIVPKRLATPAERAAGRIGDIHLATGASQVDKGDHWTGTVVKRGPGLMCVVRCLDGDRLSKIPPLCEVGDRVAVTSPEFPFMSIPGLDGHALVSAGHCLTGVIG